MWIQAGPKMMIPRLLASVWSYTHGASTATVPLVPHGQSWLCKGVCKSFRLQHMKHWTMQTWRLPEYIFNGIEKNHHLPLLSLKSGGSHKWLHSALGRWYSKLVTWLYIVRGCVVEWSCDISHYIYIYIIHNTYLYILYINISQFVQFLINMFNCQIHVWHLML